MLEKVTERIYYIMNEDDTDRPALGIVKGDKGCLVIDAGNSPRHAREFISEIEKMNFPPVKYLVITHHHWDHTFGLNEWNVTRIGNQRTKEYIEAYQKLNYEDNSLEEAKRKGYFNDYSVDCIRKEIPDRVNFIPGNVDVVYNKEMKIDLGGITCVIQQIISPHTDDSTIVYVPEERTLFLGDCLYGYNAQEYNYYDKSLMFPAFDIIEQFEADYYLCSHESICTQDEMVDYLKKLRMGAELSGKSNNLEEACCEFEKNYNTEPSKEDIYFIKSFGVGEGWGRTEDSVQRNNILNLNSSS